MTTKKPKQTTEEPTPIPSGTAARYLAQQVVAAHDAGSAEDGETVRLVLRAPVALVRGIEALAAQASRSRNYMAVQLLIAGLDGVLAELPEEKRDAVLLASMTVEEAE
jgi:hypothetical protein